MRFEQAEQIKGMFRDACARFGSVGRDYAAGPASGGPDNPETVGEARRAAVEHDLKTLVDKFQTFNDERDNSLSYYDQTITDKMIRLDQCLRNGINAQNVMVENCLNLVRGANDECRKLHAKRAEIETMFQEHLEQMFHASFVKMGEPEQPPDVPT